MPKDFRPSDLLLELEQSREVAEGLREILAILNSNRPLAEVMDSIMAHAKKMFDADQVGIYQVDIQGDRLVLLPGGGTVPDAITELTIPAKGSIITETILQKKPLIIPDSAALIERSSPILPNDEQRELFRRLFSKYRAALAVPFVIKDEIYGGIVLYYKAPREFTKEDVSLALTIGDQAALAIENAQTREQIERRAKVAEGLRDVFTILNSNRPFKEALDFIVKRTSELLGADSVGLYKVAPDYKSVRVEAGWGLGLENAVGMEIPYVAGEMDEKYSREPQALPDARLMMEQIIASNQATNKDEYESLRWIKSMIATPVIVKEETYGSLHLYYSHFRQFSEDDVELAKTFGDQAALALEHARLDTQTKEAAVSDERNRLARELHDAVTQTLFSSSLIAEVLPKIWEKDPEEGRRRLEELRQLTKGALAEMRALLLELRPTVIVEADLGDLVRQLAEAASGASRIPIKVDAAGGIRLPAEPHMAFYRIGQEALNNVVKHSGASSAKVSLTDKDGRIVLKVSDNGRGFDTPNACAESLGLGIMKERAAAAGTKLKITSRPGQGTTVTTTWRNLGEPDPQ